MATSNMKVFVKRVSEETNLESERLIFLMNCETGSPTPNEKLAANYINELNIEIKRLYKRIREVQS